MSYKTLVNNDFNPHLFDIVFDHSSQIAMAFSDRYSIEAIILENRDYKKHWEKIYKDEKENQKGFFIELYETHEDEETPVGYFIVSIQDKTLVSNVALSAKRKHTTDPPVTDVEAWLALFELTKSFDCNEFVWVTDSHGRIWEALHIVASRLDNQISFKEDGPLSEMRIGVE